jgi:hypothetical protein
LNCEDLHHAATSGSLTALKLLVEPVATLCSRSDGKTIPSAILTGLSTSASVNAANAVGRTALHIAANGGHLSCVQYLLSKGADINLADSRLRMTALHLSAAAGNEKIVTCLIENGADITLLDSKGRTALQVCCSIKQCEEAFRTSVYNKAKTSSPLDVTGYNCSITDLQNMLQQNVYSNLSLEHTYIFLLILHEEC